MQNLYSLSPRRERVRVRGKENEIRDTNYYSLNTKSIAEFSNWSIGELVHWQIDKSEKGEL